MRIWKCGAVLTMALALAACGGSGAKDTGSLSLDVSVPGLGGASGAGQGLARGAALTTPAPDAASRVASVVLTHTGPDGGGTQTFTAITNPITHLYNALPVGLYTFTATAYDASNPAVALFAGQVQVEVHKNQVTGVDLVLQQLVAPGTVENGSPVITSIVISDAAPATGETITLTASVTDPSTSQLTYQWTSSCSGQLVRNGEILSPEAGEVFSEPTSKTTSFTSYCTADETFTFSATQTSEAGGRVAVTSFTIRYSAQGGNFAIRFNSFPDILDITTTNPARNTQPPFGGTVNLVATVQDANGDAMTAAWRDNCGGSFDDPASLTPVWTAPQAPRGTRPSTSPIECKVALSLTDGQGGTNRGWLAVHVGAASLQTIAKRLPLPRFAYVLNYGDKTIGAYTVDSRTGALTAVGTVPTTGTSPGTILVAPSGKFAYVNDTSARTLSVYTIDASSGALTQSGTHVATGDYPRSFAIHPAGRFLYVANVNENTIWTYSIDGSSGALTSVGSPTPTGPRPAGMAIAPSGKSLFVANSSNRTISAYSIDSATGALTSVGQPVPTGMAENSLAVDPLSRFLYSANNNGRDVWSYSIDPASGALTTVGSVATGQACSSVAADPSGKYVYVSQRDGTVAIFTVNQASGALTRAGTVAAGVTPLSVAVDPSGAFVYVANSGDRTVSIYGIDAASGALTSAGSPAQAGTAPRAIAVVGAYPPPLAYVANRGLMNGNSISMLTIDSASGALTTTGTIPTGMIPLSVAVDPLGRFAYVPLASDQAPYSTNSVLVFSVEPFTGALTNTGSVALPPLGDGLPNPYHVAVEPSGRFAYVADYRGRSNRVYVGRIVAYAIDQTTGALTQVNEVIAPLTYRLTVDPSGRFLYAMTNNGYAIGTYSIDSSSGAIAPVGETLRIPGESGDIAVDPFGRFIYTTTANNSNPGINAFAIDPSTGRPTSMGGYAMPTGNTWSVVVDPTGRFAYAIGANPIFKIFAFSIDPGTGVLTNIGTTEVSGTHYGVFRLAMDPSGDFLHATTYFGTAVNSEPGAVVTFAIDTFTGALTRLDVPPAPTGPQPMEMSILPGRASWAYVPVGTSAKPTHVIGGTVSGLTGTVALTNRDTDELTLSQNGTFAFTTPVVEGGAYDVQVRTQPAGQTCVVTDGAGVVGTADVLNVGVVCTTNEVPTHTVGGSVTGLSGTAVLHNAGEDLTVTADGSFTFASGVAEGASYSVTVTAPASQTCSVANGSGTMGTADVTNVLVTCTARPASTFGQVCTVAEGCRGEFNVCQNFPNPDPNYYGCTKTCTADTDCPSGSQGQKCNNSGLCRP